MLLPQPLAHGTLIRRYKRFLADIRLDSGETITAHCANPGAMTGLDAPGSGVWLSRSANPSRKLPWSWELVELDTGLVGINTAHPNRIVAEALAAGRIAEFRDYRAVRPEVRYGKNSRVDFLLTADDRPDCYLEVKNVHLSRQPGLAEFPDSPTARGTKHLEELARMAAAGRRAANLFLIQRTDCAAFSLARDVDAKYANAMIEARQAGVEILAYNCFITTGRIDFGHALPIEIR